MSEFSVRTEKIEGEIALIYLKGYLDAHTFEEFDEVINEFFEGGVYKIVVDLAELEYISSAGAGVFIGALSEAQENNGNIIICGMRENVREVFDLLGLIQIFTLVDTPQDAVGAFSTS